MSERLTRRMSDGTVVFTEKSKSFYSAQIYEEAREKNRQILDRLCEIEDKIEQGEIVELPFAVGQTIYVITTDSPTRIEETKISQVVVRLKGNGKPQYSILAPCVYDDWGKAKWSFCDNNFGTDFFLDRAAAEAKVREMEGDNNE